MHTQEEELFLRDTASVSVLFIVVMCIILILFLLHFACRTDMFSILGCDKQRCELNILTVIATDLLTVGLSEASRQARQKLMSLCHLSLPVK